MQLYISFDISCPVQIVHSWDTQRSACVHETNPNWFGLCIKYQSCQNQTEIANNFHETISQHAMASISMSLHYFPRTLAIGIALLRISKLHILRRTSDLKLFIVPMLSHIVCNFGRWNLWNPQMIKRYEGNSICGIYTHETYFFNSILPTSTIRLPIAQCHWDHIGISVILEGNLKSSSMHITQRSSVVFAGKGLASYMYMIQTVRDDYCREQHRGWQACADIRAPEVNYGRMASWLVFLIYDHL